MLQVLKSVNSFASTDTWEVFSHLISKQVYLGGLSRYQSSIIPLAVFWLLGHDSEKNFQSKHALVTLAPLTKNMEKISYQIMKFP